MRQDGIGAGLNRETVDMVRLDESAETRRRLEQLKRHPPRGKLVRGRKPGDSATNDRDHLGLRTQGTGYVICGRTPLSPKP